MKKLILSLLFSASSGHAIALLCSAVPMPQIETQPIRILEKKDLLVHKSLDGRRELVYYYKPRSKTNSIDIVISHGLGDDMTKLKGLAKSLLDLFGWDSGLLMADFHGHGETLKRESRNPKEMEALREENFSYELDVVDMRSLILKLGIKNFILAGHSMGGGVDFELAAEFSKPSFANQANLISVHLLAPYAQREDKAMQDLPMTWQYWVQQASQQLVSSGLNAKQVDTALDPYFSMFSNFSYYQQFLNDVFFNFMGVQKVKDMIQDPIMDEILKAQYRKYFKARKLKEKNNRLTDADRQEIEIQAEVSVRKTKSLRELDLLNRSRELPPIAVPIQIIGGRYDKLVLPAQLKELALRFERIGFIYELSFMEGSEAGHFFAQTRPQDMAKMIHDFYQKQKGPQ